MLVLFIYTRIFCKIASTAITTNKLNIYCLTTLLFKQQNLIAYKQMPMLMLILNGHASVSNVLCHARILCNRARKSLIWAALKASVGVHLVLTLHVQHQCFCCALPIFILERSAPAQVSLSRVALSSGSLSISSKSLSRRTLVLSLPRL